MNYQTSSKVVSRLIGDELIVIQLDTGRYHYFSSGTQDFLNYFKTGRSIDSYASQHQLDPEEKVRLHELCDALLNREIFQTCTTLSKTEASETKGYSSPQFLRDGEKTLDQISFASP